MRISRRSTISIGIFLLLGVFVLLGSWYESRNATPGRTADSVAINVTNGADRGPGTLREALFIAASADGEARIAIRVKKISLASALPPLVNTRGIRLIAAEPGAEIDASALAAGPALDIAGANASIEGLAIRNCPSAGILLRAEHFQLQSTTIEACDVGVDVAENAGEILLEGNRFANNRLGLRFAASSRNTSVVRNEFSGQREAGIWAVRSQPDLRNAAINIRDNRFAQERIGIIAGNVSVLVERNELLDSREAAVQVIGAGAVVRANRISGGAAMGIVAENARAAVIDNNEMDGLTAYGVMIKTSSDSLVRGNRVHNSGYGLAFVLGAARNPSTAIDNTIIEPKFNGIDVIGDSPILRRNHVLRPRAQALKVSDFEPAGGPKVRSQPLLEDNQFDAGGATLAASGSTATAAAGLAR